MIVNIQDDILKIHSLGLLKDLLKDRTTNKNIMWATDAYDAFGEKYERDAEITVSSITRNVDVIKTRARKELENQSKRTKVHAEVFTPLWVCNKMNNYIDEDWFGKANVFNNEKKPTERVEFPEGKTWKDYVESIRLEITCGEAPFLVSRYDVETGESIPIKDRIGVLDRKLRVITENVSTKRDWRKWAIKALQATYGYEFQGDNLLIARINILMTLEEYMIDRWKKKPTIDEYKEWIEIITWNIWQMDGLTGTVPYHQMQNKQISLFDFDEGQAHEQPPCLIYDWNKKTSIEYLSIKRAR